VQKQNEAESVQSNTTVSTTASTAKSPYQCDGRTHCSQMTSYDEAVFLLKIAPIHKWMVIMMVDHVNGNLVNG
jgi:hypothetical protein